MTNFKSALLSIQKLKKQNKVEAEQEKKKTEGWATIRYFLILKMKLKPPEFAKQFPLTVFVEVATSQPTSAVSFSNAIEIAF